MLRLAYLNLVDLQTHTGKAGRDPRSCATEQRKISLLTPRIWVLHDQSHAVHTYRTLGNTLSADALRTLCTHTRKATSAYMQAPR